MQSARPISFACNIGAVHDTLGGFAVHPDNYLSGLPFTQDITTLRCDAICGHSHNDQGDFLLLLSPYDSLAVCTLGMTTSHVTVYHNSIWVGSGDPARLFFYGPSLHYDAMRSSAESPS